MTWVGKIARRRMGFALRAKRVMSHRSKKFVVVLLCVSEHFESIETNFFFENFREREARNVREQTERDVSTKREA